MKMKGVTEESFQDWLDTFNTNLQFTSSFLPAFTEALLILFYSGHCVTCN
jgi:hypothetical protein